MPNLQDKLIKVVDETQKLVEVEAETQTEIDAQKELEESGRINKRV